MEKTLVELSAKEFETLVERVIDRRLEVRLTQVMDALTGSPEEETAELQPEFAASLRRSLEQARSGEGIDLQTFRAQIGR
ncbi:MAG TPA: hypothetical protein EYP49_19795 [Anaerolineae bacterium]|nr:hypothetical protein [Anaerolineae bacterium]